MHPGVINTNIPHAVKYVGAKLQARQDGLKNTFAKFGHSPDLVARLIAAAIVKNKQRVLAGWETHMLDLSKRLFPLATDRANGALARLGLG